MVRRVIALVVLVAALAAVGWALSDAIRRTPRTTFEPIRLEDPRGDDDGADVERSPGHSRGGNGKPGPSGGGGNTGPDGGPVDPGATSGGSAGGSGGAAPAPPPPARPAGDDDDDAGDGEATDDGGGDD
jgi:hypothetical protein